MRYKRCFPIVILKCSIKFSKDFRGNISTLSYYFLEPGAEFQFILSKDVHSVIQALNYGTTVL